ncbi:serine dehydratase beta chain, partial [Segatella buccae]|uniref:serine dehydratase beta chain n=1 Tax=Segatella buccae TaxID=28126 RepID=UPI0006603A8E
RILEAKFRLGLFENPFVAPVEIVWKADIVLPFHTNGMVFKSFNGAHHVTDEWTVYSIGGGALSEGKGKDDL